MDRLMETGLFGQGLMPVNQLSQVDRYNACLKEIGLPKTFLPKFRVDGWGWSPDIAEERNDPFYLSHGGAAKPYAIILSPAQKDLPVYFPYHSFDKHLMKVVFQAANAQIADLTASTAIWIDVDQEISAYRAPVDLLMIEAITLRFHAAGGLMVHAGAQRELVHRFNNQRMAWADRTLLQAIADSVRQYGDLRFRSLAIPDIPYTNTRSFFTRAFGGLFLFRDLPGGKPLIVAFDAAQARLSGQANHGHLEHHLHDAGLMPLLYAEKLVDLQWTLYRENSHVLSRLQTAVLMRALAEAQPDQDLLALNAGELRRSMLQLTAQNKLPELYHELDKLQVMLQRNQTPQTEQASPELRLALTHPHRSLSESTWNVVRQLLVSISSTDIVRLYEYDKPGFFDQFKTWPLNFQHWAADFVRREALERPAP